MKSGTAQNPNPKSASLGKFLHSLETPLNLHKYPGYFRAGSGQVLRESTLESKRLNRINP